MYHSHTVQLLKKMNYFQNKIIHKSMLSSARILITGNHFLN